MQVSGNPAVLTALIQSGSPISTPDGQGASPLHYAAQEAREPSPLDPEAYTEEELARSQYVLQCVSILLQNGLSHDCTDSQGMQPLHWALQNPYNTQASTLLLNSGADPNAKDNHGMTVLHIAAQRGLTENCQFLLEHTGGIHGNEVDEQGQTALHHAVMSEEMDCIEYLLSCGLSSAQGDKDGQTAAHLAASLGSLQCLQLLHAYGADFSLRSVHGATPLHEAAANGHTDALEYLLSVAEDQANTPAGEGGATPLHYAVSMGHEGCVRVLLQHGGNVNAVTTNEEGDKLSPLDYCSEDYQEIMELLKSCDALPGEEAARQQGEEEKEAAGGEEEERSEGGAEDQHTQSEVISIPSRAATPTRRSQASPTFESEEPLRTSSPVERVTTPTRLRLPEREGPGLLERAMSVLKRSRSQQPPDSILSSAVGFYAAHATILAAAVIGTPLGDKMTEVAQKVATDTAEELKKAAAALDRDIPNLVWLREEEEPERTPTPEPPKPPTPPPPTPPPPEPEFKEDPYDRRLRKARAQMDMSKSPGYLAVEELVKAQKTHMKLKRQFQESMIQDTILERRENFAHSELLEGDKSAKDMRKLTERMTKAEVKSERMNEIIDQQLSEAREENDKLSSLMSSMGFNSRPTVAQWLQQKNNQRKQAAQEALINWDKGKRRREEAILLQQAITSQRALRHAAWGARKDISSRIKSLKESLPPTRDDSAEKISQFFPKPQYSRQKKQKQEVGVVKRKLKSLPTFQTRKAVLSPKSKVTPTGSSSTVRATPVGFLKIRDTPTNVKSPPTSRGDEVLWHMGQRYIKGKKVTPLSMIRLPSEAYLRATGPKTVHAERTLTFVTPEEYKAKKTLQRSLEKELSQQFGNNGSRRKVQRSRGRSTISVQSLEFETKKSSRKRSQSHDSGSITRNGGGVMFHSLADSIGRETRLSRQQKSPAVLPMTVLDPSQLPSPVATN